MLTGKKQPKSFEIDERIDRAEVLNEVSGSIERNTNGTFNVQSQYTPEACYILLPEHPINCTGSWPVKGFENKNRQTESSSLKQPLDSCL